MAGKIIKTLVITLLFTAMSQTLSAQNTEVVRQIPDTLFRTAPVLDSTYLNRDIFTILSATGLNRSTVKINQSSEIESAMRSIIANATQKKLNGFRIRIFFDNKQDARVKSESVRLSFIEQFPGTGVYRTYDNPYFKGTIGDFRTKSDAMRMLKRVEGLYPSAFIVREHINFPPL